MLSGGGQWSCLAVKSWWFNMATIGVLMVVEVIVNWWLKWWFKWWLSWFMVVYDGDWSDGCRMVKPRDVWWWLIQLGWQCWWMIGIVDYGENAPHHQSRNTSPAPTTPAAVRTRTTSSEGSPSFTRGRKKLNGSRPNPPAIRTNRQPHSLRFRPWLQLLRWWHHQINVASLLKMFF